MNAQQEVEGLLGEIRAAVNKPDKIERLTDQISILCRAYLEPPKPAGIDTLIAEARLSPAESRIYMLLRAKEGKIVSNEALMDAIAFDYQGDEPSLSTVKVWMFRLRNKMLKAKDAYRIDTIFAHGYRMVAASSPLLPDAWRKGFDKYKFLYQAAQFKPDEQAKAA